MDKNKRIIIIYCLIIFLLFISSLFPEQITGYSPYSINFIGVSAPGREHLCGTDFLGRDILSRTIIGGRISIIIGAAARMGSVILGATFGALIGLSSRKIRALLNGVVEVFLAIPSLLLAMGLTVAIGEGYKTIVAAIIIGTWAPVARFVSTQAAEINNKDYVASAKVVGAGKIRVIVYYIIPELLPILLPVISTGIASSIMIESTLSFLGLGGSNTLNTIPSWGLMIQEGSKFIFDAPWIIITPSIFLTVIVLCFNKIGDNVVLLRE